MKTIDHLNRLTKELFDSRRVCLGHVQHHPFNPVELGLGATFKPGENIIRPPALEGGNRATFVQVNDRRVVMVPLTPGIVINPDGATQQSGTAAGLTAWKRPGNTSAKASWRAKELPS